MTKKAFQNQEGRKLMHYAYSWGAAIVILGALFKLTHLPFADILLYVGMGTEVFVFFLTGFDTPQNIYNSKENLLAQEKFTEQIREAMGKGVQDGFHEYFDNNEYYSSSPAPATLTAHSDDRIKELMTSVGDTCERELEEIKTTVARTEDMNYEIKKIVNNLNEINNTCKRVAEVLKTN